MSYQKRETQRRLVLLVPTDKDMEDEKYLSTYWPNFVCRVRQALEREKLDAEVCVVARALVEPAPKIERKTRCSDCPQFPTRCDDCPLEAADMVTPQEHGRE